MRLLIALTLTLLSAFPLVGQVDLQHGLKFYDKEFTSEDLAILSDSEPPIFTSVTTASFEENGAGTAYTVIATDADANTITYSLGTSNDEGLFDIVGTSGVVTFKTSPDFEAPVDANADNDYVIEVKASDGVNEVSQTVTISLTNLNEKPQFTSTPITSVGAGTPYEYVVRASDPDKDATNLSIASPTGATWLSGSTKTVVSTIAGNDVKKVINGNGINASFLGLNDVVVDSKGNIYVTDNHRIRKIDLNGDVSNFAGATNFSAGLLDGTGVNALFSSPSGLAIDANDNIYVADNGVFLSGVNEKQNAAIRKITPQGVVTTIAGGGSEGYLDANGLNARFSNPHDLTVDPSGNLFVSDGNRIRKITQNGDVTTFAGGDAGFVDGPGTAAKFSGPVSIISDNAGNLFIADENNHRVRKITSSGQVTTLAGSGTASFMDGNGSTAGFNTPTAIGINQQGDLIVAEQGNSRIRKVTQNGQVSTIAGNGASAFKDGLGAEASFWSPFGLFVDNLGRIIVADIQNNRIRKIVSGFILEGTAPVTLGSDDFAVTADDSQGGVSTQSFSITYTDVSKPVFTSLATAKFAENATGMAYTATAVDASTVIYSLGTSDDSGLFDIVGGTGMITFKTIPDFESPTDSNADNVYALEILANDGTNTSNLNINILVTNTQEFNPTFTTTPITEVNEGIEYNYQANVTDGDNEPIFINPTTLPSWLEAEPILEVSTLAGRLPGTFRNGTGVEARFNRPEGLTFDNDGNLYIADAEFNQIRKLTPEGVVTTFAGSGIASFVDGSSTEAGFNSPTDVAFDSNGNLFVVDRDNHAIRKIDTNGIVTTVAGNGESGFNDGQGSGGEFDSPKDLAFDSSGNLFVTTTTRVKKIDQSGNVTTFIGGGHNSILEDPSNGFLYGISGLAIDQNDNLYLGGQSWSRILKISPEKNTSVFVGGDTPGFLDAVGPNAQVNEPIGLVFDPAGNLFFTDFRNFRIRKVATNGMVTTVAGNGNNGESDGPLSSATVSLTPGIAINTNGEIYLSAVARIRKITNSNTLETVAGSNNAPSVLMKDGIGENATFFILDGGAVDSKGNLYVSDHQKIRRITPEGLVETVSKTHTNGSFGGITVDSNDQVFLTLNSSGVIKKLEADGTMSILAGKEGISGFSDGNNTDALFDRPSGIVVDSQGNFFVADLGNHKIRKISAAGVVTTFAGTTSGYKDGTISEALFSEPRSLTIDKNDNLYVSDGESRNRRVRKITPDGLVSTLAGNDQNSIVDGTGIDASFKEIRGLSIDGSGNLWVGEQNVIRRITPDRKVSTIAGTGKVGLKNGEGKQANFDNIQAITIGNGGIYLIESGNYAIRQISHTGIKLTGSTNGQAGDHSVEIEVSDINGATAKQEFSIAVIADTPPIFASPSTASFVENGTGTAYTAVATDANTITYSLGIGNDEVIFDINGTSGIVTFKNAPNFEAPADGNTDNGYVIEVKASDGVSTVSHIVAITVTNLDEFDPVFTSPTTVNFVENGTGTVYTALATDANTITYSLGTDGDSHLFNVLSATGAVTFKDSPDYEFPQDVDKNNSYLIEVIANDGLNNATQSVTISVTNTVDSPVFTSLPKISIDENTVYRYEIQLIDFEDGKTQVSATTIPSWLTLKMQSLGEVSTFAGSGQYAVTEGTGTSAEFKSPDGLALDAQGNIYVADADAHMIRKISPSGVVSNFAGSGTQGSKNGMGNEAEFYFPRGLDVDANGNIYVAGSGNHNIRKISPSGQVTTIAGTGKFGSTNGNGSNAAFNNPWDVSIDSKGNLFIADLSNHSIRKISPNGDVSTFAGSGTAGFADGLGSQALFNQPYGIDIDANDNIYVADRGNNSIRKITPEGNVSTITGNGSYIGDFLDGPTENALFNGPSNIVADNNGNLFVTDSGNGRIRLISSAGEVTSLAGSDNFDSTNGIGNTASFSGSGLSYLVFDSDGHLIVSDFRARLIRKIKINQASPVLTGNPFNQVGSHQIALVAEDVNGGAASQNFTIQVIDGSPEFTSESKLNPIKTIVENTTGTIFTAKATSSKPVTYSLDTFFDESYFEVNPTTGELYFKSTPDFETPFESNFTNSYNVRLIASNGVSQPANLHLRINVANGDDFDPFFTSNPILSINDNENYTYPIKTGDFDGDNTTVSALNLPSWLSLKVNPIGVTTTVAGSGEFGLIDGIGTVASFNGPRQMAMDQQGNIYIADSENHVIRKMTPEGVVTTLAGSGVSGSSDGIGSSASFNRPFGVAVSTDGTVYVADTDNHKIRKITPSGEVTSIAGSSAGYLDGAGLNAQFNKPTGIAVASDGKIFVVDQFNHRIRSISLAGEVSTIAGSGFNGLKPVDGTGTEAYFAYPEGIAIDKDDNLYIADKFSYAVRKITNAGVVTTIAGTEWISLNASIYPSENGQSHVASFNQPTAVAVDATGNVYVTEGRGYLVRKIHPEGFVTTIAGNGENNFLDGTGASASFGFLSGILIDGNGDLIVSDSGNGKIRKITPGSISLSGSAIGQSGNHTVNLSVKDASGPATTQTFTIEINDITNPVFTSPPTTSFAENGSGTAHTVIATDANALVYSLGTSNDEALFNITGDKVTFKASPDFEAPADANTDNAYLIEIKATDGVNVSTQLLTITVTDIDEVLPVFTSSKAVTFAENATSPAYTVTATDANAVTYSLGTGNDEALFNLNGGVLTFKAAPDFEVKSTYTVQINANDGLNTASQTVVITITDVDEVNPIFTSAIAVNFEENGTGTAYTITATDASVLTFSLGTGNDEALFNIIEASGEVTFKIVPDFENPTDADKDNGYNIEVKANDGTHIISQSVIITVTNVDETAPVFTSPENYQKSENLDISNHIYAVGTQDESEVTYSLGSGHDEALFNMNGRYTNAVYFNKSPDFEKPIDLNGDNIYVFEIIATDKGGNNSSLIVNLTVNNLNESDPIITTDPNWSINENIQEITVIEATGVEEGFVIDFSKSGGIDRDAFYFITDGTLSFKNIPDYEFPTDANKDNVYEIEISAHEGNRRHSKLFSIRVNDVAESLAPIFISDPVITVVEGKEYDYPILTSDPDNDRVEITLLDAPDWLTLDKERIQVSTFAGSGDSGSGVEGNRLVVGFNRPNDVVIDGQNQLYILERARIRKIDQRGKVTTLAGTGGFGAVNGNGNVATFKEPQGIAIDNAGNIYVADAGNYLIRKITPDGIVSTFAGSGNFAFADGTGTEASFLSPSNIAIDASGNLFVADLSDNRIRKITPEGVVSVFAGSGTNGFKDGLGINAEFSGPIDLAFDSQGNLFVVEFYNARVRKITPEGLVSTFAGNGTKLISNGQGEASSFHSLRSINIDKNDVLYVSDMNMVRKITPRGEVTTLAGTGSGSFLPQAQFSSPNGLAFDDQENIYVADEFNHRIKKISKTAALKGTPDGVFGEFEIALKISDGEDGENTQEFTLSVLDVETPVFTSATATSFAENGTGTIYTAVAMDANTLTYSLGTGSDEGLLNIVAETGIVTFKISPDFEAPADANTNNAYVIKVNASDGTNTASQTVSIAVTDVDEILPVFTSSSTTSFAENGTGTAYTIVATDANTVTYSLGTSNDEALFNLNAGVLTFKAAPDFETKSTYTLKVNANDGLNKVSQTVVITITDVDEVLPVFTSATAVNYEENGTGTAYTIVATDANDVTYSLGTDNDEALFNIAGGVVTFKNAPDFESPKDSDVKNTYVLEVVAKDALGNSASQQVTITVTDADEVAPTVILSSASSALVFAPSFKVTFTFSEPVTGFDATDLTVTNGNVTGFAGASNSYSALITIVADGQVSVQLAKDKAEDGAGNKNLISNILNRTVEATNLAPSSLDLSANKVSENAAPPTKVGTLSAIDADENDKHTFALVDGEGSTDNGLFRIIDNKLLARRAFDFEITKLASVRIRATDARGLSLDAIKQIEIVNVAEPQITVFLPSVDNPSVGDANLLFKATRTRQTATRTIEVINSGTDGDLSITGITLPTGFAIDKTTATIAQGQKEVLTVTFSPTEQKTYAGSIAIASNAGEKKVQLAGRGKQNRAPIAVSPNVEIFFRISDLLQLRGYDPDGDVIEFVVTQQPEHGTITATAGGLYSFTPNGLTPGQLYQDVLKFKVVEIGGGLESAEAELKFKFKVRDQAHSINSLAVSSKTEEKMVFDLKFSDPVLNDAYQLKVNYYDLSDPTSPVFVPLLTQSIAKSAITTSDGAHGFAFEAASGGHNYFFSASRVFMSVELTTANGYSASDGYILRNEASGSNIRTIGGAGSSDGEFFVFASQNTVPENESVEVNMYAVELGDFSLSEATIAITKSPLKGSSTTPVEVKKTDNLAQWKLTYASDTEVGLLDSLQFTVTHPGRSASANAYAKVEVIEVADAPVLDAIVDQQTNEEEAITIDLVVTDPDSELTITATSSESSNVPVTISGNKLTITPGKDFNGTANISVLVSESNSSSPLSTFDEFQLTIVPVNDKPLMTAISNLSVAEDGQLVVTLSATDVDASLPIFTYAASADSPDSPDSPDNVSYTIEGDALTITPSANYNGTLTFGVTADDGEGTSNSVSDSEAFTVTVNAQNDAPISSSTISTQTLLEVIPAYNLDLTQYFSDIETAAKDLTYTVSSIGNAGLAISGATLTVSSLAGASGVETTTITASDGELSVSQNVTFVATTASTEVTVANPVTDQVLLEDFGVSSIDLSGVFALSGNADASFTYVLTGNNTIGASMNGSLLELTSVDDFNGVDELIIIGTVDGKSSFTSFKITVNPANDAPSLTTAINDVDTPEDATLSQAISANAFSDVDGDVLTYSASYTATWLSFDAATRIFSGTPANGDVGTVAVTVTATDPSGATATDSFNLVVSNTNDEPTAITFTSKLVDENLALNSAVSNLTSVDVDPGDDTFTYTLVSGSGSDDNDKFDVIGNQLVTASTFDFESKTSYAIRIKTTDGFEGSYTEAVTITINNVNEVATGIDLNVTSIAENQSAGSNVSTLTTTDPDAADSHSYSLVSGEGDTDNNSFTITDGKLTAVSAFDFETKSNYSVRIKTTDAGGLSFEKTFTITITNVNEAATDLSLSASTIAENASISAEIADLMTTDPDAGDTHGYSLAAGEGDGDNANFKIEGAKLLTASSFNFEDRSSYSVRLKSTDASGLSFEKSFTVTVTDVNDAPSDITADNLSVEENQVSGTTIGSLTTADQDSGDSHSYSLASGEGDVDNASFSLEGNVLKATASFDFETKDSYAVRVKTTDAAGLSFERALTVAITNQAEAQMRVENNASVEPTELGSTATFNITIFNDGDGAMNVTGITYPQGFSGASGISEIAASGSAELTISFSPTEAKTYSGDVVLTYNGGEQAVAVTAIGEVITAIDDGLIDEALIKVYPNPATNEFTLDLTSFNGQPIKVSIVNGSGINIYAVEEIKSNKHTVNVRGYSQGIYIVMLRSAKQLIQKKLVIRR